MAPPEETAHLSGASAPPAGRAAAGADEAVDKGQDKGDEPAAAVPTLVSGTPLPGASDPLIGTVLADRYEIRRRIGEGGMGAVYEGRHVVLGRQVAVKVLLEKFHEKTELVARLLQEARLASAIGHENIVDVTDFGTTADGRSFVVMEFLEGESLAQTVIRDAPLAVDRCLRIARQVASALGAAHSKGIVHRDVKPENVFMLRRGEQDFVKVVDFGVSKAVRSRDDGADLLRLTRTGMVLGTPLYMSPEQARGGDDVDVRADIWAVGVMLYECLTGEVPFRANNYLGVISQVLTQEVQPPSRLRPELGIPPAVEAVVMRAMEKDREKRYQTMPDLERDLDRLLAGDPNVGLSGSSPALPVQTPPIVGARWHLGVAAVLVVGVALAFSLARTEEERRVQRAAAARASILHAAEDDARQSGGLAETAEGRGAAAPAAAPAVPTARAGTSGTESAAESGVAPGGDATAGPGAATTGRPNAAHASESAESAAHPSGARGHRRGATAATGRGAHPAAASEVAAPPQTLFRGGDPIAPTDRAYPAKPSSTPMSPNTSPPSP